jgi:NADH:ubiquinone oxidoreductase subunit E
MIPENSPIEVTICLGSSCFARGNAKNLALLKKYEQENEGSISLKLTGSLCQDHCKQGPNLSIDGRIYNDIGVEKLRELLQKINREKRNHGTA